jgi:hypothetical protein
MDFGYNFFIKCLPGPPGDSQFKVSKISKRQNEVFVYCKGGNPEGSPSIRWRFDSQH